MVELQKKQERKLKIKGWLKLNIMIGIIVVGLWIIDKLIEKYMKKYDKIKMEESSLKIKRW